jgi:hypothetical protein
MGALGIHQGTSTLSRVLGYGGILRKTLSLRFPTRRFDGRTSDLLGPFAHVPRQLFSRVTHPPGLLAHPAILASCVRHEQTDDHSRSKCPSGHSNRILVNGLTRLITGEVVAVPQLLSSDLRLFTCIRRTLPDAFAGMADLLTGTMRHLARRLACFVADFTHVFGDPTTRLRRTFGHALTGVRHILSDPLAQVRGALGELVSGLGDPLSGLDGLVRDTPTGRRDRLAGAAHSARSYWF